jgi:hypothetical protein
VIDRQAELSPAVAANPDRPAAPGNLAGRPAAPATVDPSVSRNAATPPLVDAVDGGSVPIDRVASEPDDTPSSDPAAGPSQQQSVVDRQVGPADSVEAEPTSTEPQPSILPDPTGATEGWSDPGFVIRSQDTAGPPAPVARSTDEVRSVEPEATPGSPIDRSPTSDPASNLPPIDRVVQADAQPTPPATVVDAAPGAPAPTALDSDWGGSIPPPGDAATSDQAVPRVDRSSAQSVSTPDAEVETSPPASSRLDQADRLGDVGTVPPPGGEASVIDAVRHRPSVDRAPIEPMPLDRLAGQPDSGGDVSSRDISGGDISFGDVSGGPVSFGDVSGGPVSFGDVSAGPVSPHPAPVGPVSPDVGLAGPASLGAVPNGLDRGVSPDRRSDGPIDRTPSASPIGIGLPEEVLGRADRARVAAPSAEPTPAPTVDRADSNLAVQPAVPMGPAITQPSIDRALPLGVAPPAGPHDVLGSIDREPESAGSAESAPPAGSADGPPEPDDAANDQMDPAAQQRIVERALWRQLQLDRERRGLGWR